MINEVASVPKTLIILLKGYKYDQEGHTFFPCPKGKRQQLHQCFKRFCMPLRKPTANGHYQAYYVSPQQNPTKPQQK